MNRQLKPKPLADVFNKQKKLIKIEDKVENLKVNATVGLYYVLHLAHKPEVKWLLPEGIPPFKRDAGADIVPGLTPSDLYRELRVLYLFLEGGHPTLKQLRREMLFVDLLERLHGDEILMIESLKDGTFKDKYRCPKKVVELAFPGLLNEPFNPRFLK